MTRGLNAAFIATTTALLMAGHAEALTLTNRDAVDRRLQISEATDEAVTYEVVISAHETLVDLCRVGCTIELESGELETFEGYEEVNIEEGSFVFPE